MFNNHTTISKTSVALIAISNHTTIRQIFVFSKQWGSGRGTLISRFDLLLYDSYYSKIYMLESVRAPHDQGASYYKE